MEQDKTPTENQNPQTEAAPNVAPETPAAEEQPMTASNGPAPAMPLPIVEKKKSKLPLVLLIILLLVGGGAAAWWFLLREEASAPATQTTPATSTQEQTAIKTGLNTLPYWASSETGKPGALFWTPLDGGAAVEAKALGSEQTVMEGLTNRNNVLFRTSGANGETIFLSTDGGKTYESIVTTKGGSGSDLGEQITSVAFSKDGSKIVMAVLVDGTNTVKQYDLATKETKDLFSVDKAGVFIQAYDSDKNTIIYSTGCYNCDGNRGVPLLLRDLAKAADTELIADSASGYVFQHTFKEDMTKMLYVTGAASTEGIGPAAPYKVMELDIATKTSTTLKEVKDSENVFVGYSKDGTAYYAAGNKVQTVKDVLLYESSKPIFGVHYVDAENVVVSSGTFSDFQVVNFEVKANKVTDLLSGGNNTKLAGVTIQ